MEATESSQYNTGMTGPITCWILKDKRQNSATPFIVLYTGYAKMIDNILRQSSSVVRCPTSNQRVVGSIPGHSGHFGLFLGKTVYSILLQSTQLQNGYLA